MDMNSRRLEDEEGRGHFTCVLLDFSFWNLSSLKWLEFIFCPLTRSIMRLCVCLLQALLLLFAVLLLVIQEICTEVTRISFFDFVVLFSLSLYLKVLKRAFLKSRSWLKIHQSLQVHLKLIGPLKRK